MIARVIIILVTALRERVMSRYRHGAALHDFFTLPLPRGYYGRCCCRAADATMMLAFGVSPPDVTRCRLLPQRRAYRRSGGGRQRDDGEALLREKGAWYA